MQDIMFSSELDHFSRLPNWTVSVYLSEPDAPLDKNSIYKRGQITQAESYSTVPRREKSLGVYCSAHLNNRSEVADKLANRGIDADEVKWLQ